MKLLKYGQAVESLLLDQLNLCRNNCLEKAAKAYLMSLYIYICTCAYVTKQN